MTRRLLRRHWALWTLHRKSSWVFEVVQSFPGHCWFRNLWLENSVWGGMCRTKPRGPKLPNTAECHIQRIQDAPRFRLHIFPATPVCVRYRANWNQTPDKKCSGQAEAKQQFMNVCQHHRQTITSTGPLPHQTQVTRPAALIRSQTRTIVSRMTHHKGNPTP